MAYLGEDYTLENMPESNFEPIPAGWYNAQTTSAELKDTKSGTGQYIAVRYDITGPTHEGRVIFFNINIRNTNATAENIGRQQLGDLMAAVGLQRVTDTDELVGHHVQIQVVIEPAKDGYDASNRIKRHKAIDGGSPAPAPEENATPPWKK